MINSNFFLNRPVAFKNICKIYPPTVNQVIDVSLFPIFQKMLTISRDDLEDEYIANDKPIELELTPFEYILSNAYHDESFMALYREAIKFFTHEDVVVIPENKMIVFLEKGMELSEIKSLEELRIIHDEEYFDFQNLIREACGQPALEPPNPKEDARVRRIKAKARMRDRIKSKKSKGTDLGTLLASICCMGIGITPLNIGELSYPSVLTLLKIYQQKEKYQIDIDSLLAGADSKQIKPKYWIGNIDD